MTYPPIAVVVLTLSEPIPETRVDHYAYSTEVLAVFHTPSDDEDFNVEETIEDYIRGYKLREYQQYRREDPDIEQATWDEYHPEAEFDHKEYEVMHPYN